MKIIGGSTSTTLPLPCWMRLIRRSIHVLLLVVVLATIVLPSDSYRAQAGSSRSAFEVPVERISCYGVYHVVGRGQTIYSIAATYGTTAYRIAICNGLGSYSVYAGQSLLVPVYRRTR